MFRLLSLAVLASTSLSATSWYVSPSGSDANAGTSPDTAFMTIRKAANTTQPGDIVNVADGVYTNSCAGCPVADITRSGAADAWIVYRAWPGAHPHIHFTGWAAFSLHGGASYIQITGFDIRGSRTVARFETCRAQALESNPDPLCNGNGISIDGRQDGAAKPHHIRIDHNRIWQCAGGGVAVMQADYVTTEDNIVSENAWYARYAASGISYYQSWNSDSSTTTKMIVRRNTVFNNRALVDWTATGTPPYHLSDGNCIIVDDLRGTQNSEMQPYVARTLVENNLAFDCGGGGITIYSSDHVDVFNNTTFKNSQVVDYGEIFINQSGDVRVENNIFYSRDGATTVKTYSATGFLLDYNLYFNGSLQATAGPHDLTADPLFISAETDNAIADFHPLKTSPAASSALVAAAPADDQSGRLRSNPAGPSRGALEPSDPYSPNTRPKRPPR